MESLNIFTTFLTHTHTHVRLHIGLVNLEQTIVYALSVSELTIPLVLEHNYAYVTKLLAKAVTYISTP